MPVTGLFFLPNTSPESSPSLVLIQRLIAQFDANPLPPWTLSCRLFRETPSSAQPSQFSSVGDNSIKSKPPGQRVLQIISLSHHAPRTYVAITSLPLSSQTRGGTPALSQQGSEATASGETTTVNSIPVGGATEDFTQLITTKFGPLWQPRQVLHVTHGATLEVGDFKIRFGDLKQGYTGGTQMSRGTVCEIEWAGAAQDANEDSIGASEGQDWKNGEQIIREFWNALDVKGAREVLLVPGMEDGDGSVRQWCEVLRLRSQ